MTNLSLKKFISQNLVLSFIVFAINFTLFNYIISDMFQAVFYFLTPFFFFISTIAYIILKNKVKDNPVKFVNTSMAITGAKLMIYLAFVLIYLLNSGNDKMAFVLVFFIHYFVYTSFEIIKTLEEIKKSKNSD